MPLFTNPVTLTDGTTPAIFTYQQQETVGNSIVHTLKELAADTSQKSTCKAKYNDSSPTLNRSVFQRNLMLPIEDGTLEMATVNISVVHHKEHSIDSLTMIGKQAVDATNEVDFWLNFFNQM